MRLGSSLIASLLGLAAVTSSIAVSAYAQTRAREVTNAGANTSAPSIGERAPSAVPLTSGECRGLGGTIIAAPNLCTTGLGCSTEDQDGVLRHRCIDELDAAGRSSPTSPVGAARGAQAEAVERAAPTGPAIRDVRGEEATVATPLTRDECTSLGGSVRLDIWNRCSRSDYLCTRRGADGRLNAVCINEAG